MHVQSAAPDHDIALIGIDRRNTLVVRIYIIASSASDSYVPRRDGLDSYTDFIFLASAAVFAAQFNRRTARNIDSRSKFYIVQCQFISLIINIVIARCSFFLYRSIFYCVVSIFFNFCCTNVKFRNFRLMVIIRQGRPR